MINEATLDYYIYNGEVINTKENMAFEKIEGKSIYEVIRIINGKPLYLGEHLDRLRKSSELLGYEIKRNDKFITSDIYEAIKLNNVKNQNIKILINELDKDNQINLIYFIKSNYPDENLNKLGIHTILIDIERKNPNVKSINKNFKNKVNEMIKEQNAYEGILLNDKGHITEGSRSNIFFVKNNTVYTAPDYEILLGVTRDKILKVCNDLDVEIMENIITVDNLKSFDGAFMTGTSVDVLPIKSIGDIKYDSVNNKLIKMISKGYLEDVKKDLEKQF